MKIPVITSNHGVDCLSGSQVNKDVNCKKFSNKSPWLVTFVIFVFILFSELTSGHEPILLQRISEPITLDSKTDEPVWATIEPLVVTSQTPAYGSEPHYPTFVKVAYDDQYMYVSAVCYTPESDLFLTSYRRDHLAPNNDYLAVVLDTFNDNENALVFSVMPSGARLDYTVFNDAQGPNSLNTSWNTFWDAETSIFEDGWTVNIRIPFSSLRFQDDQGRVEMGIIIYRWFAVNASVATFPAIPPNWGFWSFHKPSRAQKIVMEGVYNRKTAYVTPYVLGGMEQTNILNPSETRYMGHFSRSNDIGLDIKYGLTNNLTMDLTLNTDFAQVEADDQQLNLTRFPLFFPEKRLFFQERSSIFDFGAEERSSLFDFSSFTTNRLFYSRRIGLYGGQLVPLLGGARLVGRVGDWDIGFLNMQSRRIRDFHDDGQMHPSENFGVLRIRRQLFNPFSYIGMMGTSRYDENGRYNVAYGLDGNFRIASDDYLSFSIARTGESSVSTGITDSEGTHVHTRWEKRSFDGFGYDVSLSRSGEMYNPESGFILRTNYTRIGDRIFYGWFPGEKSLLRNHQVYLNGAVFFRNTDGGVESAEYGPSWEAAFKSGNRLSVKAFIFNDNLTDGFALSDNATVPHGNYEYYNLGARYEWLGGKYGGEFIARGGTFYDGSTISLVLGPRLIVSRHLQFQTFYMFTHIDFPAREQVYNGHLARIRMDIAFNRSVSIASFIQYNNNDNMAFANLRFRYNPREGLDFYLVYNEGYNTYRDIHPVRMPFTNGRSLLLKYSHTLVF
jgi:hypothetical protein